MAKNIVICSDGTGNWAGDAQPSNVYRLCNLLDLNNESIQIACYDPGVGTNVDKHAIARLDRSQPNLKIFDDPLSWMPRCIRKHVGSAGGYGLKENLKQLYGFLVENYVEGDNIYLFGFSRGAFTVRALAGMLCRCGVLKEMNLFSYAHERCKIHYENIEKNKGKEERKNMEVEDKEFRRKNAQECKVKFLGIWDTVKAYGYIRPKSRAHTRNNEIVLTVRHALSIDERRKFYEPTHWGGLDTNPNDKNHECKSPISGQNVKEVWFAGDHSDVGGGHEDGNNGLAQIALNWMIKEAANAPPVDDKDKLTLLLREDKEVLEALAKLGNLKPNRKDALFIRHDKVKEKRWQFAQRWVPRWEMINCPYPHIQGPTFKYNDRRNIQNSKRDNKVLLHSTVALLYDDAEKQQLWGNIDPDPEKFSLIESDEYLDK